MQFHLKINTRSINQFNEEILFTDSNSKDDCNWKENQLIVAGSNKHTRIVSIKGKFKTAWLIGDPILEKHMEPVIEDYLEKSDYSNLLQKINGHFRLVVFDKKNVSITVSCSLFGILPLYYYVSGEMVYLSTNSKSLSQATDQKDPNRRFILENTLFYYQLFNQTAYKNIYLLPAQQLLEISESGTKFVKHTSTADWFVENPKSWSKSTEEISDLFVERVRNYLPDEPYIHALTGGFDSRSLVSCGLYYQRKFETYSFGSESSDDAGIAAKLSSIPGLKFNLIRLDRDYVVNHSLENGLEFIDYSEGNAGFARAHYLFACKSLSSKSKYLVTGNFGSEIFRAAHNAGAVVSPNLYHLFNADSLDSAFQSIKRSKEFEWINRGELKQEWDELKADIAKHPVFANEQPGMTRNKKFYLFVLEEVFRKYFGAEMSNQSYYVNNRTPFLDTPFLKEIFKTGLAGVYSEFFEDNPLKRFKGQVLYAHFIRKTYPAFNEVMTEKGYRPKDLLSLAGKFHITKHYLRKKLRTIVGEDDPNKVGDAFAYNRKFYQRQAISHDIFNVNKFKECFNTNPGTHDFLIAVSQSLFFNRIFEPGRPEMSLVSR